MYLWWMVGVKGLVNGSRGGLAGVEDRPFSLLLKKVIFALQVSVRYSISVDRISIVVKCYVTLLSSVVLVLGDVGSGTGERG